jgi:hypothetical protein
VPAEVSAKVLAVEVSAKVSAGMMAAGVMAAQMLAAKVSAKVAARIRGPSEWRQVAKDGSESPRPSSFVRAVVVGWVAASVCCRVVSAKVLGDVVVSVRGMVGRILRRS